MKPFRTAIASVTASVALITLAAAQTSPQPDTTSPSAASTPHQRAATSTQTPEAAPSNGSNPAAASSPHQAQVTAGSHSGQTGKSEAKQTMKSCVIREQADHTGMSRADANKACKDQLKVTPQK